MVFQPGQSGNPNGRAKGKYTEYTQKFLTLRSKAAEDVDEAYSKLKKAMDNGEQWAFKIYFDHLVRYPAKEHQAIMTINVRNGSPEEVIESFTEGLQQVDQYNVDDALDIIKTYNNVKLTKTLSERTNEAAKLSDDQIKMITGMVTDMNKTNDQSEIDKDES